MLLIPGNRFVILRAVWDFSVSVSSQAFWDFPGGFSRSGFQIPKTLLTVGENKNDIKIVTPVEVSAQMEGSA